MFFSENIPVPVSAMVFAARRLAEFSSPVHESRTDETPVNVVDLTESEPEVASRGHVARNLPITKAAALTFEEQDMDEITAVPTPDIFINKLFKQDNQSHTVSENSPSGQSDLLSQVMAMFEDGTPASTDHHDAVDLADIFGEDTQNDDVNMEDIVDLDELEQLADSL